MVGKVRISLCMIGEEDKRLGVEGIYKVLARFMISGVERSANSHGNSVTILTVEGKRKRCDGREGQLFLSRSCNEAPRRQQSKSYEHVLWKQRGNETGPVSFSLGFRCLFFLGPGGRG